MTVSLAAADLLGAALTLISLGALALGGYLLALRMLGAWGARAEEDPLEMAVASLLASTAEGVALALLLGAPGFLRIAIALPAALLVAALLFVFPRRLSVAELAAPLRAMAVGVRRRLAEGILGAALAALSILALHGIGSEGLRGLLRPPLSWDSVMYHLQLTATWLQTGNLQPVFGAYPMNYYGYAPANGGLWLWWWMAPSHSELYANLAFLPQWALLGLATGALARRLGARRSWPLAGFLAVMTPTVLRFAATEYVDVFTGACLVAALVFGLRWLHDSDNPRWGDSALAGLGIGVAAGAKVLGIAYGGAMALFLILLARGSWGRRAAQAAAALVLCVGLGGFFYLRNAARGVDPLALKCEGVPHDEPKEKLPPLPRPNSVAALPGRMLGQGELLHAFAGTAVPGRVFIDLGLGPQAFLLLLSTAVFPFVVPRRREGLAAAGSLLAMLAVWATVPYAASGHVYANVRYLDPAIGIAFAGGLAAAEALGAGELPLAAIAVALVAQDLLQLHAEMPFGVRMTVAAADLLAIALALSPALRGALRRHLGLLALATAVLLVALAPWLGRFRAEDRERAFSEEYTAHVWSGRRYAPGWAWLDRQGGDGAVDVVSSPDTFFVYPAMGPRLERRATYVNVNREDLREAAFYPRCQPRTGDDPEAWLQNLGRENVRWLYLSRTPPYPFPEEDGWAAARPRRFALRFQDPTNRVWEVLPTASVPSAPETAPGAAEGGR